MFVNKVKKQKTKKQSVALAVLGLAMCSLWLAACGETPSTAAPTVASSVTASTIASSTSQPTITPAATPTTSPATTSSPTMPGVSTTPTKSAKSGSKSGNTQLGKLQTPDQSVTALFNQVKNSNQSKATKGSRYLDSTLKASLKNKKQAANTLTGLLGLNNGQIIQSFTVGSPTINGNNATVTATLTLNDGSSLTDNLALIKSTVSTKKGQSYTLWQVDSINTSH